MAASIDNLYDALRAAIPTYSRFSAKKEILNPYSLEDNPETFLDNSWGLIIGSSVRAESDNPIIDYHVTTIRDMSVVITRAVYDLHNIGVEVNEQAKELLLDARELRDNFLDLLKFGVLQGGEEVLYLGDSGVEFAQAGQTKFISTQVNFTFELIEIIN